MTLAQPAQTQHDQDGRWTARLLFGTPYAHTTQHTFDTTQYIALSSDRSLLPVRNPFHTAYTDRNRGSRLGHETRTPEACNRLWSCTSVHSPEISECVQGLHAVPPASNNARWFECTSHGSLGKAEYTFASLRLCDAPLESTTDACRLLRPRTTYKPWVRSRTMRLRPVAMHRTREMIVCLWCCSQTYVPPLWITVHVHFPVGAQKPEGGYQILRTVVGIERCIGKTVWRGSRVEVKTELNVSENR